MQSSKRRGRIHKNTFTTRNGKTIKVNQSFSERRKSRQDARALKKAKRLSGMPKSRFKRFFFRQFIKSKHFGY